MAKSANVLRWEEMHFLAWTWAHTGYYIEECKGKEDRDTQPVTCRGEGTTLYPLWDQGLDPHVNSWLGLEAGWVVLIRDWVAPYSCLRCVYHPILQVGDWNRGRIVLLKAYSSWEQRLMPLEPKQSPSAGMGWWDGRGPCCGKPNVPLLRQCCHWPTVNKQSKVSTVDGQHSHSREQIQPSFLTLRLSFIVLYLLGYKSGGLQRFSPSLWIVFSL